MEFQENKTKRIQIFEDTLDYCERERELLENIVQTMEKTRLYINPRERISQSSIRRFEEAATVHVSKERTLEAAGRLYKEYFGQRIGVLNFASATNPGGGVIRGSNAQEECICRCSTLYPCLNTKRLLEEYYQYHRKRKDMLYTNSCIYTPEITVFKSDIPWPKLLPREEWFTVDVISCAAPNLRGLSAALEAKNRQQQALISDTELEKLLIKRAEGIFQVALENEIEILVLGAFGCGSFCNSPYMVANAFKKAMETFQYAFQEIQFAVHCAPAKWENYDIFSSVF